MKAFVVGISDSIFRMKKRKESRNYPTNSTIATIICVNLYQVANRVWNAYLAVHRIRQYTIFFFLLVAVIDKSKDSFLKKIDLKLTLFHRIFKINCCF